MLKWLSKHKLIAVLVSLIVIVSLLISTSSYITQYAIKNFLEQHSSDVVIKDVKLSLWDSSITINGLTAKNLSNNKIQLKQLFLDWNMADLWQNKLTIESFKLDGFNSDITTSEFELVALGPILVSELTRSKTESETESEQLKTAKPWNVEIKNIAINNVQLCLAENIILTRDLVSVIHSNKKLAGCLSLQAFNTNNAFTLVQGTKFNYQGNIELNTLRVNLVGHEVINLEQLALQNITLSNQQLDIKKVELLNTFLLAQKKDDAYSDVGVKLGKLQFNDLSAAFGALDKKDKGFGLISSSSVGLSNLKLMSRASDNKIRVLGQLESLAMSDVGFNNNAILIAAIELNKLALLENFQTAMTKNDFITKLDTLSIQPLEFKPSVLSMGEIKIKQLQAFLLANDKGVNASRWFPEGNDSEHKTDTVSNENNHNKLLLSLQQFNLGSNSMIEFIDQTNGQDIQHQLSNIKLDIGRIDLTDNIILPTPLKFAVELKDSGELKGEGEITFSEGNPKADIKGKLKSLNLVNLSGYASRFIGYRIDQGQLNVDYQIVIADGKIDSNFKTHFDKFELADLEDNEQHQLNQELGVPLPMALNLLRESDDSIALELPVKGDLSSPDFSVSRVISKVTVKAIKNAVIYNYSPLGVLSLASGLFDLATALRFDPIKFEARQVDINQEGKEQLVKVIKIMQKKPRIKIVICGVATQVDRIVEPAINDNQNITVEVPEFDRKPLLELAKERQQNVINFIALQGEIDKNRLLGCNVKLSKKADKQAEVSLSI